MISCTPALTPRGPGPVHSKRPAVHISARRLLQAMSLGPWRVLKQESVSPINRKSSTGGKGLSAHEIIDTLLLKLRGRRPGSVPDPEEDIHGNSQLLLT